MAMMRPDTRQICEVSLIAAGYVDAERLTEKFLAFHRLCAELLSAQQQYDFGTNLYIADTCFLHEYFLPYI